MSSNRHLESLEAFAQLDFHRRERTGIPEAVLAEGKTPDQILDLLRALAERSGLALATRVPPEVALHTEHHLRKAFTVEYHATGRVLVVKKGEYQPPPAGGVIAVLAAGTSDLPVAEEAKVTAEAMGCRALAFYDVGVAGIHRLVKPLEMIREHEASAVVAVAGMEGALPTVVRGLVPVPVIGVPTSVGYGYGGKGEAALMTMLQSCAPGLTVVNIDNGFGAGATAALIANRVAAVRHSGEKEKRPNSL